MLKNIISIEEKLINQMYSFKTKLFMRYVAQFFFVKPALLF